MWRCRFDVKTALDWKEKDKAKKKRNPQSPAQRQGRVSSSVARPNPRFWGDRATLRAVNDSEQGRCGGRHMSRPLIYHIAGCRPFSVSCNRATARTWPLTGRRANSHTQDRTDFTSSYTRRASCVPPGTRPLVLAVGLRAPMSGCKSSLSSPIIGAGASSGFLNPARSRSQAGHGSPCACRSGTPGNGAGGLLWLLGWGLAARSSALSSFHARTYTPQKKTHTGDAVHEGFSHPTPYPKLNK